jgi:hypothetical protein
MRGIQKGIVEVMRTKIIIFGFLVVSAATVLAQPPAKRPPLPANLAKYVGESSGALMNVPAVKSRLKTLLGKRYTDFVESTSVQAETKMVGDFLLASGCMAHACTIMEAAFAIDMKNKRIHAVLYEKDKPPLYFNEDRAPTPQVLIDHVAELKDS